MPRIYPLDPGERDRVVTIQAATHTVDASTFPTATWADMATAYMAVTTLSGREQFRQGQTSAAADTRFEMPYASTMDPDTVDVPKDRRLVYRGRTYDIVAASMIARKAGIELMALSRVG